MVEQLRHAVVIILCGIKSAGGNQQMPLTAHIVSGRMPAAPGLPLLLFHKREVHGQLPVDKIFQKPRNAEIVKRKAPDHEIRPQLSFDALLHVVCHHAFARRFVPAGKTAPTGSDLFLGKVQLSDLCILVDFQNALQKCFGEL